MIVFKQWTEQDTGGLRKWLCSGYYLFGVIPLFVRKVEENEEYLRMARQQEEMVKRVEADIKAARDKMIR